MEKNSDISQWVSIIPSYYPPRVFISYRHHELDNEGFTGKVHNTHHWYWVKKFAEDLRAHQVEVVNDLEIQKRLLPIFGEATADHPAVANIIFACVHICNVFMPIVTPAYLARLGYVNGEWQKKFQEGYVYEEFAQALQLSKEGKLQFYSILREGSVEELKGLPFGWNERNLVDMSDEEYYEYFVRQIAYILHTKREVQQPAKDCDLDTFLYELLIELDILPNPLQTE